MYMTYVYCMYKIFTVFFLSCIVGAYCKKVKKITTFILSKAYGN